MSKIRRQMTGWARHGAMSLASVFILLLGLAPVALAQGVAPGGASQVTIEVESFGLGGVVRRGDMAGLRVVLTDTAVRPREVAVRLTSKDVDGDPIEAQRFVTLNPGQRMGVWLYWVTPFSIAQGSVFTVSIHEATSDAAGGFDVGRQIAARRVSTGLVVHQSTSLIGVVGLGAQMGLGQLEFTVSDATGISARHGRTAILGGLVPPGLPDDAKGFACLDALVWKGEDSSALSGNQVRAMEQWVRSGGHLIIPIRSVGLDTLLAGPLAPMFPEVEIGRRPGVDLEHYRNLLTDEAGTEFSGRLPESATIHAFEIDPETEPADATCIVSGIDGCVVVRRLLGTGRVTLIGIDVASSQLVRVIQADRFWNRIIGIRGDVPPDAVRAPPPSFTPGLGRSSGHQYVDQTLPSDIAKGREASLAILAGMIVFLVYALIAGPIGFGVLKARSWQQHAWVAFVGVALVFTLISWFSVNAAKPTQVEMKHLTLLRHIYGQPQQRARVLANVLLPEYGEQRVSVGDPDVDQEFRQAVWPFQDPLAERGAPFPDSRAYQIDVRDMDTVEFPARSTMKQIRAEWLGGPRLSMPVPASFDASPRLHPESKITGQLVHQLPAPLTQVRLILIEGQTSERDELEDDENERRGRLRARGSSVGLQSPWVAGVPLDLAATFSESEDLNDRLRKAVPFDPGFGGTAPDINEPTRQELIALLSQVRPKDYTLDASSNARRYINLYRELTHGFDLGVWFTEPCLIILGIVDDVECPVPISVDGRRIGSGDPSLNQGRVLVQWVYPLRGNPAHFTNPPEPEAQP